MKIVLPELGQDRRIDEAAKILKSSGQCEILNVESLSDKQIASCKEALKTKKKFVGLSSSEIDQLWTSHLIKGALMVDLGLADGMVAGAINSTADVLRAGLRVIGLEEGCKVVSSCFLMKMPNQKKYIFADCAVNPSPNADNLADIAKSSVKTARLLGIEPRVAMLSASTKGSAKYEKTEMVAQATKILQDGACDFVVDGEVQADAALVTEVAKTKKLDSPLAQESANVLVFPDLDSGNIGYKLVERLAGAKAIGPILQGFAKPINDLSRGCSVEDIVEVVGITIRQIKT